MGNSILNSMRHSLRLADQLLGDADSLVLALVIDSGDRSLLPLEEDTDEDTPNNKVGPLPDDTRTHIHGYSSHGTSTQAPESSVEPKEEISSTKVEQYKLSQRLDYAGYLSHLAVFGFLGVFTRYGLQKLFAPGCLALTSNQSPLYLDIPSNVLGSFLMAWFGIIFRTDIRYISDHLIVGITIGYIGWNQAMIGLSSKGHWSYAIAGIVLGISSTFSLKCYWSQITYVESSEKILYNHFSDIESRFLYIVLSTSLFFVAVILCCKHSGEVKTVGIGSSNYR